jgi:hypothetical protein
MKLTPLLLLISVSAFAQQKQDHIEPRYNYQKHKPVQKPVKEEDTYFDFGNGVKIRLNDYYDSTNVDTDTDKELFDLTKCICPLYMFPDVGKEWRPREQHPYQWDTSKPLVIFLDSADLKDFKGVQFYIDTTRTKKTPTIF